MDVIPLSPFFIVETPNNIDSIEEFNQARKIGE